MLFEVAILSVPTTKKGEEPTKEELLFGPKAVLAKDQQTAVFKIMRDPELAELDLDKVAVLIRPFA